MSSKHVDDQVMSLIKQGKTQTAVAKQLGLSRSTVQTIIYGRPVRKGGSYYTNKQVKSHPKVEQHKCSNCGAQIVIATCLSCSIEKAKKLKY